MRIEKLITTRRVWLTLLVGVIGWIAFNFLQATRSLSAPLGSSEYITIYTTIISLMGYALAATLSLVIAQEHAGQQIMRTSWMLLGGNAVLSVFRALVESPLVRQLTGLDGSSDSYYFGLTVLITAANISLMLGIVLMILGVYRTGLGLIKCTLWEAALFAVVIATFCAMLLYQDASGVDSSYIGLAKLIRIYIGPFIWLILAVGLVLLHRVTIEIGSAKLAVCLRFLTAYVLLRSSLYVLGLIFPHLFWPGGALHYPSLLSWQVIIPWLLVLATAYRLKLTRDMEHKIKLLETANRAAAISQLNSADRARVKYS